MSTCKRCDRPATRRVVWADGRAEVPACGEHVGAVISDLRKRHGKLVGSVQVKSAPRSVARPGTRFRSESSSRSTSSSRRTSSALDRFFYRGK